MLKTLMLILLVGRDCLMDPRQTPTTSRCPRTGQEGLSGDRGDLPGDSSSDYIRSHLFSILLMSIHIIV